jgi:hypothetical protein
MSKKSFFKKLVNYLKNSFLKKPSTNKIKEKASSVEIQEIQKKTKKQIYITTKGEEVKSRMEKEIADFLASQKINYQYEKACRLSTGRVVYPDFYLSDYDVYIEYFGMLGNKNYNYSMRKKIEAFKRDKIRVIELYPNNYRKLGQIIKIRFEKVTQRTFPQRAFIDFKKN